MGYGGTLHFDNLELGIDGQLHAQGIWDWRDRAHSISYRELKEIRKLLMGHLVHKLEQESVLILVLHVDNQAVVCITSALVSSNRPMVPEPSFVSTVGASDLGRMDTACCEPDCRWHFATLPTRRFADPEAGAVLRGG